MSKQKFYIVIVLVLTLAFSTKALASLTFSSAAITGDTASTIDVGSGHALSLQTTGNGNIITGTGNFGIGITPTNKLTVSGTSNFTGHMAIGNGAQPDFVTSSLGNFSYNSSLMVNETLSSSVNADSIASYPTFDPTVNNLAFTGIDNYAITPASNNKNIAGLTGGSFFVDNYATGNVVTLQGAEIGAYQDGTGSVTNLLGTKTYAGNYEALVITNQIGLSANISNSKVGSTITNGYELKVADIANNVGTYTNTYGIYIGDVSIGTQTNYPFSLYSSDANSYNYFAGNVGVGVTAPSQKLEVNGGVRLNTVTAKPTCDATVRGTLWTVQGGAGVADTAEICRKGAADTYSWVTIY